MAGIEKATMTQDAYGHVVLAHAERRQLPRAFFHVRHELRIEAFAEAFYAAAIVGFGVCAGAGQTMVPTIINLGTMWVVRIVLALFLTSRYGLTGYWISMCADLSLRGIIFLLYVRSGHWLKKWNPVPATLGNDC